jgi:hypothetical protein
VPVPAFVQAGTGTATTTGTGTVSLAGCTAGNIVLAYVVARGNTDDYTTNNFVNIEALNGTDNAVDTVITGSTSGTALTQKLQIGRVMAGGTVSVDQVVGASGEDLFGCIYEFSGVSTSAVSGGINTVFENGVQALGRDGFGSSGTSLSFSGLPVITNGANRLGLIFGALSSNQATGDFTGESGGYDFTETTPEFASATGATCTLLINSAPMAAAGTCDSGSQTIVSANWVLVTFALIPVPDVPVPQVDLNLIYLRRNR